MYLVADAFSSRAEHCATVALNFLPRRPAVLAVALPNRIELRTLPHAPDPIPLQPRPGRALNHDQEECDPDDDDHVQDHDEEQPELLSVVGTIPVAGTIVSIQSVPRRGRRSVLLLFMDPDQEHVLAVEADPQPDPTAGSAYTFITVSDLALNWSVNLRPDTGVDMWTDLNLSSLVAEVPVPLAVYSRSRVLGFVPVHWDRRSVLGMEGKFESKLPHADVLSLAPIYRRSAYEHATYAVLSISSLPESTLGVGPQGLPVLYFLTLYSQQEEQEDGDGQAAHRKGKSTRSALNWTVRPEPWILSNTTNSCAGAAATVASPSGTKRKKGGGLVPVEPAPKSASANTSEPRLDSWVEAHVPLPPIDAITAHLILSVPAHMGKGVLVFTEQSVLYVPPPLGILTDNKSSSPADSRKRFRPGSGTGSNTSTIPPIPAQANVTILKTELAVPVQVVAAIPLQSLPQALGNQEQGRIQRVLFATHAGELYIVHLYFVEPCHDPDSESEVVQQPFAISVHIAGQASSPSGSHALTHLGEDYVHVASSTGDPMVVHLAPTIHAARACLHPAYDHEVDHHRRADGVGFKDLGHSPIALGVQLHSLASVPDPVPSNWSGTEQVPRGYTSEVVKRWDQLGPIVDVEVDGPTQIARGQDGSTLPARA